MGQMLCLAVNIVIKHNLKYLDKILKNKIIITIIPRAWIASESIAHSAFSLMAIDSEPIRPTSTVKKL